MYSLIYAIFYRGLEYLWIVVFMGSWNLSPKDTKEQLSLGGVKSYLCIFNSVWGLSTPNPHVVQCLFFYLQSHLMKKLAPSINLSVLYLISLMTPLDYKYTQVSPI